MGQFELLSKSIKGNIRSIKIINANAGDTSTKRLNIKDYRGHKVAIDEYKYLYDIGVVVESVLCCAVNRSDKIMGYRTLGSVQGVSAAVFFSDSSGDVQADHQDFWNELGATLRAMPLQKKEGLFFCRNRVSFIVDKDRDVKALLDDLIDVLQAYPHIFFVKEDLPILDEGIPEILKPLLPLLRKLAIADDNDRDRLREKLSAADKRRILKLVRPLFGQINLYLDSFGEMPLSDTAVLIGDLAQLAAELAVKQK
jgi:hypothetical protein